jgi:hypothetical protein
MGDLVQIPGRGPALATRPTRPEMTEPGQVIACPATVRFGTFASGLDVEQAAWTCVALLAHRRGDEAVAFWRKHIASARRSARKTLKPEAVDGLIRAYTLAVRARIDELQSERRTLGGWARAFAFAAPPPPPPPVPAADRDGKVVA